ncbi:uncharacterized protein [Blastocystis hominis]|uniref:Uncharacterized protein n=1 Tax=Blastocystis hominis TaxID=12968 RepID=D8M5E3_BLAHO|nr:uncharacterized protein [Blastocystis hominis]CBK23282.2 unnamed protein product [Blastocystis hominis]|eukprot:XP_012897330.1 uncharacterized protein [Blastocystis hominis]
MRRSRVKINGRTALITGGASGIGLATAKLFAETGMNVVIWDKNMDNLQKTKDEVLKHMKKGFLFMQQHVDVSSKQQIETAHSELSKTLSDCGISPVSIIVNNAGSGASECV